MLSLQDVFKKKKVKGNIYYDLVKNVRKGSKVMHEYLTYVGKLSDFDDMEKKALLMRVESLLLHQFSCPLSDIKIEQKALLIVGKLKQKTSGSVSLQKSGIGSVTCGSISDLTPEFSIKLNTLKSETHRSIGVEWLCHQAIKELGILDYLSKELFWSNEECSLFELSLLGRLIHRGSERSTANWLATDSGSMELQDVKIVAHREALRLSALSLQNNQEQIESFIYDQIVAILKEDLPDSSRNLEKCYYDLSNVYFEGRMQQSDLAQYGRSKEKRTDQPIVSYSLLTNEQGIIKKSQVYPGNVSEPCTFEEQIEGVDKQSIFFCDAGIATKENIYYMLKNVYRYMCVAREGFSQFSMDFQDAHQFEHHCSNGDKYQVWLKSEQHQITIEDSIYRIFTLCKK